ncbi:MAG TPA: cyclomaltodextrinase N-terminal domain-containing protein, partial [Flavisolibacter sp.]|nr:cyclomaltodextrinase N-terminal domain-containing protein [Flavisolibacter sp.]
MRKLTFSFLFFLIVSNISAQTNVEVYPTNWYVGMKNPKLQLMLHGKDIGSVKNVTISYPGITVEQVHHVEGKNYLFVDIRIAPSAKPGQATIKAGFENIPFEFKARRKGKGTEYAQGVDSRDFIYLIMPDRFSNGDYSNDKVPGMKDQSLNRDSMYARHGGDLQGVINHLDYLQDLGVNTIWMTPVIENDMPNRTEHGYAFTNHYKIDPR